MDCQLFKSLLMLGSVVEARDPYTGGHLWRVAKYSKLLSARLELSPDERFRLTLGAFLHDLGKIGIPDSVLLKSEPLTEDEFAVIRTHPQIGTSLLREHPLGDLVVDVVEHHHEWIDGRGYPGLAPREKLTVASRIVGLVDAFDALTSTRPYRQAKSVDEAFSVIEGQRGTQFDGNLIDAFRTFAATGELENVVAHSFEGRPLVMCPNCGPVIAITGETEEGDEIPCRVCGGIFHLHESGETFEAKFADRYAAAADLIPRPDAEAVDYHLVEFLD